MIEILQLIFLSLFCFIGLSFILLTCYIFGVYRSISKKITVVELKKE
jgi:hypothetical protein